MAMYIYQTDGHPVGFRFSNFIHDMGGRPLGRILGTHVYRIAGSYVGELFKETVVAKPTVNPRSIQPVSPPPVVPAPGASFRRRGLVAYGYRRSEEHTSELQSLMRISYAVFCLKKHIHQPTTNQTM